jgi:YVTN family beta-propeller protein
MSLNTVLSESCFAALIVASAALVWPQDSMAASEPYRVYVSNERSGDVTVISGADFSVIATIPAGKRPRGIHASPDGRKVFVALSGTPIGEPPKLDAQGNPIFNRPSADDDDDTKAKSDKSADGIGIIDVASGKLTGMIRVGSDPEEFALSKDGTRIYVSNEDIKTASVVNVASGRVEHILPVGQEPEGVATTPDGKRFFVTCEAGGDIYVFDTGHYTEVGHFKVPVRPRTVAFLPDSHIGFIPSETAGLLNVIDTADPKVLSAITLPKGSRPMSVKIAPDGLKVYVSDGRAGTISVLDAHSYALIGSIAVGQRPWGIALSPDGRYLFSANGPSNDVSVVDLASGKEVRRVKAGQSPWGLTVLARAH